MPDRSADSNRENVTVAVATAAGQLRHCLGDLDHLWDTVSVIARRAWGDAPPISEVQNLQRFDELRQRLDGLADALALIERAMRGEGGEALPATLASLPLGALAQAFAAAYGVEARMRSDGNDFELF